MEFSGNCTLSGEWLPCLIGRTTLCLNIGESHAGLSGLQTANYHIKPCFNMASHAYYLHSLLVFSITYILRLWSFYTVFHKKVDP